MRRRFVLLLLLLLPLQVIWSAAAAYCRHDADAASRHFGHHVHRHVESAGADTKASTASVIDAAEAFDKQLGAADLDCSQCHGPCTGLPDRAVVVTPPQLAQALPLALANAAPSPLPWRPERPQWPRLA